MPEATKLTFAFGYHQGQALATETSDNARLHWVEAISTTCLMKKMLDGDSWDLFGPEDEDDPFFVMVTGLLSGLLLFGVNKAR
jgi:hypothetical protein